MPRSLARTQLAPMGKGTGMISACNDRKNIPHRLSQTFYTHQNACERRERRERRKILAKDTNACERCERRYMQKRLRKTRKTRFFRWLTICGFIGGLPANHWYFVRAQPAFRGKIYSYQMRVNSPHPTH